MRHLIAEPGPGTDPASACAAALAGLDGGAPVGVAVSGGGDSVALLLTAIDTAGGRPVRAVTVDHGLRPESAAEAEGVSRLCAGHGVPHEVLRWEGWDGRGNLQAAAREARFALIGDWARREGLAAVLLGHTLDDQAETVLMRLARGSGIDGLAGMAPAIRRGGVLWLRPLLGVRRAALRAVLRDRGVGWVEDPTNDDPAYDRVKARQALEVLAPLGITAEGLAGTATRLAPQRAVIERAMAALAREARVADRFGCIRLLAAPLGRDRELGMRLLADSLCRVSGRVYRPRSAPLARLWEGVRDGAGDAALHGCLVRREGSGVLIAREPAAVAGEVTYDPAGTVWDGRFLVTGGLADLPPETTLGALGEAGLAALGDHEGPADWQAAPRLVRLTLPALRNGVEIVCVPHADFGEGASVTVPHAVSVTALAGQELPETAPEA